MTFYTQPKDEILLDVQLDSEEIEELRTYLEGQNLLASIKQRGMGFDSAFDPRAVVETIRHSQYSIKVAKELVGISEEIASQTLSIILAAWVISRNTLRKAAIKAKQTEPLILDQNGHRFDLRPESKKRRGR